MKGFACREFQLVLLRRMADFQPELVIEAYGELGATHSQYMAAQPVAIVAPVAAQPARPRAIPSGPRATR